MVKCSICGDSMRRSQKGQHEKGPSLIFAHMLAMQSTISRLATQNDLLEKRIELVTSRDRERLVRALGAVRRSEIISSTSGSALSMEAVVGAEARSDICTKPLLTEYVLVKLLIFLTQIREEVGKGSAPIVYATLKSINTLLDDSDVDD